MYGVLNRGSGNVSRVEKNAAPKTAVREYNVSAKSYIRNPNVGFLM